MKEVYIIMSPSGGISLDISTSKGTCYEDLEVAKKELEATNRWSRNKGYGVYELVTLKVVETEKKDERAKKEHELVGLYHDLLKLIGIYNSSTYCTKETRKDLKEKIKKIQTQIDELEKELEELNV